MLHKSLVLRWIVGLLLLGFLFTLIDFDAFLEVLQKAKPGYFLLAVLLVLFDRIFMGAKWRLLIKAQGVSVTTFQCIRAYYVASLFGLVMPSSVGADLIRIMKLPVGKGEREKIAASIAIEKILGMFALLFLACISLVLMFFYAQVTQWKYFMMFVGVLLAGFPLFFLSLFYMPKRKFAIFQLKIFQVVKRVVLSYQQFRFYRKALFQFFILSVFVQLLPFVFTFILVLAFDLPGTALGYFIIVPIIYLVVRIPISIDGIGVLEGMSMLLFPIVGLSKTDSLLLALSGRVATTLGHLVGGIFYFLEKPKTESKTSV